MCAGTKTEQSDNITQGLHHLGLTVPDVEEASSFFVDTLGYSRLGKNEEYPSIFVSDGTNMLTLWQTENKETQCDFDHKNQIGLHHFCIKIKSTEAFETLHQKLLADDKVNIEFGPEAFGDSTLQHIMCEILGGLRIEFIAES